METVPLTTDLNLSAAVKEIVEAILKSSPENRDSGLHIHIKSSANNISSNSRGWLYVKVLTSINIKKETFSDFPASSALYEVLRTMHGLEDESHLCLQSPGQGMDHSVQYNLILSGHTLVVQQEVMKSKPVEYSTLYLRMHQNLLHVIQQCREIHNHLMLLKVFRPQWDIAFNMKLGDVQSRNDFRFEKLVVVSNSLDPDQMLRSSDPQWDGGKIEYTHCPPGRVKCSIELKQLEIFDFAMYSSHHCLMTIYGPGLIPLEMEGSKLLHVFETVNWSQFGLKMSSFHDTVKKGVAFPCHSIVALETYSHSAMSNSVVVVFLVLTPLDKSNEGTRVCRYDLDFTLEQHSAKVVQCIEGVLEKALLPLQEKVKVLDITLRSITSVCKAVTDVVTMSDNEEFRKAILSCMQVDDTVDLGNKLEATLTGISKDKHHGIWAAENPNVPRLYKNIPVMADLRCHMQDNTHIERGSQLSLPSTCNTVCDTGTCRLTASPTIVHTEVTAEVSPFYELGDSDTESSAETEAILDPVPVNDLIDKTPEIGQITESLEQVSPFQEFGEAFFVGHCHNTSTTLTEDPYKLDQRFLGTAARNGSIAEHVQSTTHNSLTNCSDFGMANQKPFQALDGKNLCQTATSVYSGSIVTPDSKEEGKIDTCSNGNLLKTKDWSALFDVVSNFIDNTAADILGTDQDNVNNDQAIESESVTPESKACMKHCNVDKTPCSDDWFDDVLEEVEDWLN